MSPNSVCRLCLAIDAPMRTIINSPLQDIYEKLTNISLNSTNRPVVACCPCYYQLRKCRKLLIKSVRADELLTRILQSGALINQESISTIDRKAHELSESLTIIPVKPLIFIQGDKETIKEEQLLNHDETNFNNLNGAIIKKETSEEEEETLERELEHTRDFPIGMVEIEVMKQEPDLFGDGHQEQSQGGIDEKTKSTHAQHITSGIDNDMTALAIDNNFLPKKQRTVVINKLIKSNISERGKNVSSYSSADTNACDMPIAFNCNDCGCIFDFERLLIEHNIVHHRLQTEIKHSNENNSSSQIFSKEEVDSIMNKHKEMQGEENYECGICLRKFTQRGTLKTHLRIHTGEKPFECNACERKFYQRGHLTTHLRTHTGEKPYECDICKKNFARRADLTQHLRIHTGEKRFECKICLKKFSQRGNLNTHVMTHSKETSFKCTVCAKQFRKRQHLRMHSRKHTGDQPYQCAICDHKFRQRGHLETHLRTHTGEKPFECTVCGCRFSRNTDLTRHVKRKHRT